MQDNEIQRQNKFDKLTKICYTLIRKRGDLKMIKNFRPEKDLFNQGYKVTIFKTKKEITEISFIKKTKTKTLGISYGCDSFKQKDLRDVFNFIKNNEYEYIIN